MVRVALHSPLKVDGRPDVVGYFRNIGLRCPPEELLQLVEKQVEDGTIQWDDSEYSEVKMDELSSSILEHVKSVPRQGVWYMSGRILFPAEACPSAAGRPRVERLSR